MEPDETVCDLTCPLWLQLRSSGRYLMSSSQQERRLTYFKVLSCRCVCPVLLCVCVQASCRPTRTVRTRTSCWWGTRRTWPTSGRSRRNRPRSSPTSTGGFMFPPLQDGPRRPHGTATPRGFLSLHSDSTFMCLYTHLKCINCIFYHNRPYHVFIICMYLFLTALHP